MPRVPPVPEQNSLSDIVIAGAARTPMGAFNGAFAPLPAADLGKVAIAVALSFGLPVAPLFGDDGPTGHFRGVPTAGGRASVLPAPPRCRASG